MLAIGKEGKHTPWRVGNAWINTCGAHNTCGRLGEFPALVRGSSPLIYKILLYCSALGLCLWALSEQRQVPEAMAFAVWDEGMWKGWEAGPGERNPQYSASLFKTAVNSWKLHLKARVLTLPVHDVCNWFRPEPLIFWHWSLAHPLPPVAESTFSFSSDPPYSR